MRSILVTIVGVAAYYALLGLLYAKAPYTVVPHWWRQLIPNSAAAVTSWFTLLNLIGAILAAIPIALGMVFTIPGRNVRLGLLIGGIPAFYIVGGALVKFGPPRSAATWITDIAQFLAVSLAVATVYSIICRPLTNAWSGRES